MYLNYSAELWIGKFYYTGFLPEFTELRRYMSISLFTRGKVYLELYGNQTNGLMVASPICNLHLVHYVSLLAASSFLVKDIATQLRVAISPLTYDDPTNEFMLVQLCK